MKKLKNSENRKKLYLMLFSFMTLRYSNAKSLKVLLGTV